MNKYGYIDNSRTILMHPTSTLVAINPIMNGQIFLKSHNFYSLIISKVPFLSKYIDSKHIKGFNVLLTTVVNLTKDHTCKVICYGISEIIVYNQ